MKREGCGQTGWEKKEIWQRGRQPGPLKSATEPWQKPPNLGVVFRPPFSPRASCQVCARECERECVRWEEAKVMVCYTSMRTCAGSEKGGITEGRWIYGAWLEVLYRKAVCAGQETNPSTTELTSLNYTRDGSVPAFTRGLTGKSSERAP